MKFFKKDFMNELGNSIRIEVEERNIDGVEGVFISISGPNSFTENHMTRLEAKVLCEQVELLLGDKITG